MSVSARGGDMGLDELRSALRLSAQEAVYLL
jgi:hypothetical protein